MWSVPRLLKQQVRLRMPVITFFLLLEKLFVNTSLVSLKYSAKQRPNKCHYMPEKYFFNRNFFLVGDLFPIFLFAFISKTTWSFLQIKQCVFFLFSSEVFHIWFSHFSLIWSEFSIKQKKMLTWFPFQIVSSFFVQLLVEGVR